jgi:predicted DsbA family dithiol-disulfide isomerase
LPPWTFIKIILIDAWQHDRYHRTPMVKVTYYLEVLSSWCYWAEPAWKELKLRYEGAAVQFDWKIALMDETGLPVSREQSEWFYRRSGTIARSPFMLNAGWLEAGIKEYLPPNLVALAARGLGAAEDRVRLSIAEAALRHGRKVHTWDASVEIAAKAADLDPVELKKLATSPEVEAVARGTTQEFHALKVTQRPTFVVENEIGDRAVLSGTWKADPLVAVIESQLADEAAYKSWAVHCGNAPTQ